MGHGTGESWMWTIVRWTMVQWAKVQMSHSSGSVYRCVMIVGQSGLVINRYGSPRYEYT